MNPIIRLDQLSFARKKDFAIDNLSLDIQAGKITTLVGPNGSGKSTLLRLIMHLLKPDSGSVLIKGKPLNQYPAKILAKEITMLSQSPESAIDVVVHDLVAYGRIPHKSWLAKLTKEDEQIIDWALTVCGLQEFAYRPLHTLSGGERQRAWLAMSLAQKTPILLLDEPTTFLDIAHQLELLDLLRHLNKKYQLTIILVLHDLNQAALYSDYCVALENGQIVASGTPKQVFTSTVLTEVFHIQAKITETQAGILVHPLASTRFTHYFH